MAHAEICRLLCVLVGHNWKTHSDEMWQGWEQLNFEYQCQYVICSRCHIHLVNSISNIRPRKEVFNLPFNMQRPNGAKLPKVETR